jgi:regulator of protease activity HflC (stomatin/prohibitin superfamily)
VINADGEFQAANRLADAAEILHDHPMALQLRYLQTMREISAEQNTTTIFPFPLELFRPFLEIIKKEKNRDSQ